MAQRFESVSIILYFTRFTRWRKNTSVASHVSGVIYCHFVPMRTKPSRDLSRTTTAHTVPALRLSFQLIFSSSLHSDKMLSNLLPTAQISDLDISADTSKIDRCWKKASRPPIESTRYKEERKKITISVHPQPKTV